MRREIYLEVGICYCKGVSIRVGEGDIFFYYCERLSICGVVRGEGGVVNAPA